MGNAASASGHHCGAHGRSASSRFRAIADNFGSLEEVQAALRREGLEDSNLIVVVDFTASNGWNGKHSFGGRSLHAVGAPGAPTPTNPYERAMSTIAQTLSGFDSDGLIPCYGFGDALTQDRAVFSFNEGDAPCRGLQEALLRYRQLAAGVKMAGPTSFAPAIYQALRLVAASGGQFHILLLLADGQVTRSSDLEPSQQSPQERATVEAIVAASHFPLSIIMVGVGDGPWDQMREFDDALPARRFDNFQERMREKGITPPPAPPCCCVLPRAPRTATHRRTHTTRACARLPAAQFVEMGELDRRYSQAAPAQKQAAFALRALMEIPEQYRAVQKLGLLGGAPTLRIAGPPPLPPPVPAEAAQHAQHAPAAAGFMGLQGTQHAGGASGGGGNGGCGLYPPVLAVADGGGFLAQGAGPTGPPAGVAPAAPSVPPAGAPPRGSASGARDLFVCPITQELMQEPVIAADGYTYERAAISAWLAAHDTSPMTNEVLAHAGLTPNHALRSAIMEQRGALGGQGTGGR